MPHAPTPFQCISPADFRYWRKDVAQFMSEEGYMGYLGRVELALSSALVNRNICPASCAEEIERAIPQVKAEDVYEEEGRTHHDINAYNNVLGRYVSLSTKRFIHIGATSSDKIDTANAARIRDCITCAIIPDLKRLVTELIIQAIRHKDTPQISRTHLQHALPSTFGFSLLKYIGGLTDCIISLEQLVDGMPGKMSGAIGGYHSFSVFIPSPIEFECFVLDDLKLKTGISSTQVVLTQRMQRVFNELQNIAAVLADMGDDFRDLQRPEIAETCEPFAKGQQGSSTMKHKRNPITFENAVGLWRVIVGHMATLNLCQSSNHQRDLRTTAPLRTVGEILNYLDFAVARLTNVFSRLQVFPENMQRNLKMQAHLYGAEAAYIHLALAGLDDANGHVARVIHESTAEAGTPLHTMLNADSITGPYMIGLSHDAQQMIAGPDVHYYGLTPNLAETRARECAELLHLDPDQINQGITMTI